MYNAKKEKEMYRVKLTFIVKTGMLSVMAAYLSCCMGGSRPARENELRCLTLEVNGGYGYAILCGEDTLIRQTRIPAIGGGKAFDTRRDAMQVGKLVCRKLFDGESPSVTPDEVKEALKQARDK